MSDTTFVAFYDTEAELVAGVASGIEMVDLDETPNIVEIEVPGLQGPTGGTGSVGPAGPAGPMGPSGGAAVIFDQQVASDHWVITHSGGYPGVTVVASDGTVVFGDIVYTSSTQIDILWGAPFSGKAFLNY